jgi:DHA1 family tetracycline resistance protein-like MFS transporter
LNATHAPGARKAALAFIFVTVLIDVIAFGVIIPVLPHLVEQMVGGDLSCFGLAADFVFMALAPTLAWLFVGRLLSAATSASFSTANAYIADVVPAEQRAKSFGMIGAAFGLGFIVGPLIGGVLGDINHRLPFWFAAGLALLNFLYGLFVLPE